MNNNYFKILWWLFATHQYESATGMPVSSPSWMGFPLAQLVKNPPAVQETWVQSLGWEDPLEKGKATHSSILAWKIPRTIQSMGLQRVGHDWETFTSLHFLSWISLPPSTPGHSSRLSQSTSFEYPVSYIKVALVIYFTYGKRICFNTILLNHTTLSFHSVQKFVLYVYVSFAALHVG